MFGNHKVNLNKAETRIWTIGSIGFGVSLGACLLISITPIAVGFVAASGAITMWTSKVTSEMIQQVLQGVNDKLNIVIQYEGELIDALGQIEVLRDMSNEAITEKLTFVGN